MPRDAWHRRHRPELVAFAAVLVFGVAVRLARPLTIPIWYDEAATWLASTATWGQLLLWRHHFEHPPLSFALVKLCRETFGESEFVLRLPSLVGGLLCIPAAWWAGRELAGTGRDSKRLGGIVFAVLVAGGAAGIAQAGQARMYTLLSLASLVAIGLVARGSWTIGRTLLLGLTLAAALLSHHLGYLLLAGVLAAGLVDVLRRRTTMLMPLTAVSLALLLALPGVIRLTERAAGREPPPTVVLPGESELARSSTSLTATIVQAHAFDQFRKDKGTSLLLTIMGVAGAILLVRHNRPAGVALLTILATSLIVLPIALQYHHFFSRRYLILSQLCLFGGIATLAATLPTMAGRIVAGVAVGIALWGGLDAATAPPEPDHLAGALIDHHQATLADVEVVACFPDKLDRIARYYGVRGVPKDQAPDARWFFASQLKPNDPRQPTAVQWLVDAAGDMHRQLIIDTLDRHAASLWHIADDGTVHGWTGQGVEVRAINLE
jgi:hypothetical protein